MHEHTHSAPPSLNGDVDAPLRGRYGVMRDLPCDRWPLRAHASMQARAWACLLHARECVVLACEGDRGMGTERAPLLHFEVTAR